MNEDKKQGFLLGLLDLLRQNVIIQGLIAFSLVNTICIMYIMQKQVPTDLLSSVVFIIGFYFGSKSRGSK